MPVAIPMPTTWDEAFAGKYIPALNGCWMWTGTSLPTGYGQIHTQRQRLFANRLSLTLSGVDLRPDQLACHHCDNKGCIRPDHLYAGTKSTNALDALRRGQMVSPSKPWDKCRLGHPMSDAYVSTSGRRNCRQCALRRLHAARGCQHHHTIERRVWADRYSVPRRLVPA